MKIDKKLLEQHVTQYIAEVYADSLTRGDWGAGSFPARG